MDGPRISSYGEGMDGMIDMLPKKRHVQFTTPPLRSELEAGIQPAMCHLLSLAQTQRSWFNFSISPVRDLHFQNPDSQTVATPVFQLTTMMNPSQFFVFWGQATVRSMVSMKLGQIFGAEVREYQIEVGPCGRTVVRGPDFPLPQVSHIRPHRYSTVKVRNKYGG